MPLPSKPVLPQFPKRADAGEQFTQMADTWAAALPPFSDQIYAISEFTYNLASQASSAANAALLAANSSANSASIATTQASLATTNGAAQVTLAKTQAELATTNGAYQVSLAAAQVKLATNQANLAESYKGSAVTAAAAAQSAAGLPAIAGKAGNALTVSVDELGNEFVAFLPVTPHLVLLNMGII